jgi:hypothetical protein
MIYSGWALMGAPHKVIFVFHHAKLYRYSIITGNTYWNSRDLSPSVDTKRKFGGHPENIRTPEGNGQCALFNILRDSCGFLVGRSFHRSPTGS